MGKSLAKVPSIGCCLAATVLVAGRAEGQCVAQWHPYAGPALNAPVFCVAVWDSDGSGPLSSVIVAGGNFDQAGGTILNQVGMWNGSAWLAMDTGVNGTVVAVTVFDPDGVGPALANPIIGGSLSQQSPNAYSGVARFNGAHWVGLGSGLSVAGTFQPEASSFALYEGSLIASGLFEFAGGVPARNIARWDGESWSALNSEFFGFDDLTIHAGSLYAAGSFPRPPLFAPVGVARWNGQVWENVGQNFPPDTVFAVGSYHGELIAGGSFTNACCGNSPAPGEFIAAFDGTTWHSLGSGMNGTVRALCVFDPDGTGPTPDLLIVGGSFTTAGGQPASSIAAWDGVQWSPLGAGASGTVRALTVWNNQLVVGGGFFSAGGLTSPGMAFWGCPLLLPCYANCDSSTSAPILNISDFSCFLNSFASAGPYANCDKSTRAPTLNILDFICFLNKFAAGCS